MLICSLREIISYLPVYELIDGIHINQLDWHRLLENPRAAKWAIKRDMDHKDWSWFSSNPSPDAVEFIIKNIDKADWAGISVNTNSDLIEILTRHFCDIKERVDWYCLARNPSRGAINLLIERQQLLPYYSATSANPHPDIVKIVLEGNNIEWDRFSENPNEDAIKFLMRHKSKIDYDMLSRNPNPDAFKLLMEDEEKIDWCWLAQNTNKDAFALVRKNMWRIPVFWLSGNPLIFEPKLDKLLLHKFD